MQDSLFIRALKRQKTERTPIWIMRQAGRYLPEYRAVRQQVKDFWELCKTPELACEVTLQPLRRYALDAAIVFSDILTVPDALGATCDFIEQQGPVFRQPFQIQDLNPEGMHQRLDYVYQTIRLLKQKLPVGTPLLGFSGSPWTLACYMIEGRSSRDFAKVFNCLYRESSMMHALMDLLTQQVADYLIQQAEAGADALMIFDTWGGILPAYDYQHLNLVSFRNIIQQVKAVYPDIPVILYGKNTGFYLEHLAKTGCDGLGLDWTVDIGLARQKVGHCCALQGNLDPKVLLQTDACIQREATRIIHDFGPHSGHIFNLGHGITPEVKPEAVQVLLDTVHQVSQEIHGRP